METHPNNNPRRLSKEILDEIHSNPSLSNKSDDESPYQKAWMNQSDFPKRPMNEDSIDSESSPVRVDKKDLVKIFHSSQKERPSFDIHNNLQAAEDKVDWEFEETPLPNFPKETDQLRVLAITWNLFGKRPKSELDRLFNSEKVKHHIISIGTEECLRSIPASTFFESKSYWVNLLRKHLDSDYIMVKSHSMNALHLTLFVHRSIVPLVKEIESSEVRTGIANLVGNKGGIGITFKICGTSFLFINCHLASGQNRMKKRVEDWQRIMNGLELPRARFLQEKKMKQMSHMLDRFDFVIWSGDFNFRVNETRENTINFLKTIPNNYDFLLKEDQMLIEKRTNELFKDFQEGPITFRPTYKYQLGAQSFDAKKKRTPAWTDRIFYACKKDLTKVQQLNYQSFQTITMSDHRPVFSQFLFKVEDPVRETENDGLVKTKTSHCNIF